MEKPPPPPPNVTTFCRFRGVIFDDVSSMLTSLHNNMSKMHHNDFQIKSLFELCVDLSLQCFLISNDNNIKEYHDYDLEKYF